MKSYLISAFKKNNVPFHVFNRDGGGKYVAGASVYHGAYFICNGNYIIHALLRQKAAQVKEDTFTIGDKVNFGPNFSEITSFTLVDTDNALINLGNGLQVTLKEAKKWIVPKPPPQVPIAKPAPVVKPVMTIEEIEAKIIAEHPKLRLAGTLKATIAKMTFAEFIVKFFSKINNERSTKYVQEFIDVKGVKYIEDEVQTVAGKRRSLGDLFSICRYYYPNCKLIDLLRFLYITLPKELIGYRTSYCKMMNKRAFYCDPTKPNEIYDKDQMDEFGVTFTQIKKLL